MKLAGYTRLLWGTFIEITFGVVLFIVICLITDDALRSSFLRDTASDWISVTGQVLFPAAVAIWITYVNIESSQFGDYLRYVKAAGPLHFGFAYPSLVFLATTIALIFTKGTKLAFMPNVAVFLLLYSTAVFFVMVLNVASLLRLYGGFRAELARERKDG